MPINILVVDDHPAARVGLKAVLEAEPGFVVVGEADTGARALELATSQVDLVIMDLSLPDMSGALVTERILRQRPLMKVLIFSGYPDPALAKALIEAGAAGFVLKTSACDEVTQAIRQVVKGETYLSPTLMPTASVRHSCSPTHARPS